jgi:hypothetical protein
MNTKTENYKGLYQVDKLHKGEIKKLIFPNGYQASYSGLFIHWITPCDTYIMCGQNNDVKQLKMIVSEIASLPSGGVDWALLNTVNEAIKNKTELDKGTIKKAEYKKYIIVENDNIFLTQLGRSLTLKIYLNKDKL